MYFLDGAFVSVANADEESISSRRGRSLPPPSLSPLPFTV